MIPDDEYPADPYPGVAPGFSFVHLEAASHRLAPDPGAPGGWSVDGVDLDAWLADRGAPPMAARVPVLTFGSNRCPSKLTWLREHLGLAGPVVVLRARVAGVAAVWAAGWRARDGARPATLAVAPDTVETHAVWMATPEQVAVLDACEGRGKRYDLARLHAAVVTTEDGARLSDIWTYWPAAPERAPLLVDGRPVRCADVDQATARTLVGEAAPPAVGAATPQAGAPDPTAWPAAVFVYGTLRPDGRAWSRIGPLVTGAPVDAWVPGRLYDTGRGYPALRLGGPGRAVGTLLSLRDPAAAMPGLDAYEGPDYHRVRTVTYPSSDGIARPAWVWMWDSPITDRAPIRGPWGRAG